MALITLDKAAEILAVSRATVRRHIPTVKIGGCIRVDESELRAYILSRQTGKPINYEDGQWASKETKMASTKGQTRPTGGQPSSGAAERVDALLGLG